MKKCLLCALLCLCLTLTAFASQEAEDQLQKEISAFEITALQRELASANEAGYAVLDAGRGNSNWINTQARYAFTRLMDATIGDYYPSPSRCLSNSEAILNAFLQATLYNGVALSDQTGVFPTEGGSAAMVYIFETLSHNRLLKPGDQIAIATPISRYYTLIDVYALVEQAYGPEFLKWFKAEKTEVDFLDDLAGRKGVVLMYGPGFSAPDGSVRISLANLNTEDYVEIARRLFELLDEYYAESNTELSAAA